MLLRALSWSLPDLGVLMLLRCRTERRQVWVLAGVGGGGGALDASREGCGSGREVAKCNG